MPDEDNAPSLKSKWALIFKQHTASTRTTYLALHDRMFCRNTHFQSWLTAWPANHYLQITDAEITLGIHNRFDAILPSDIHCPRQGPLLAMNANAFTQHIRSCVSCGGWYHINVHNSIIRVMHKTFLYHNTSSRLLKPGDMPIEQNKPKSSGDLLVTTTSLNCLDIKVTTAALAYETSSRLKTRYKTTENHYRRFSQLTGIRSIPIILSTYGTFAQDTLRDIDDHLLSQAVRPSELRKALILNCQMELLRSMLRSLHLARVTHRADNTVMMQNEAQTETTEDNDAWIFTLGNTDGQVVQPSRENHSM